MAGAGAGRESRPTRESDSRALQPLPNSLGVVQRRVVPIGARLFYERCRVGDCRTPATRVRLGGGYPPCAMTWERPLQLSRGHLSVRFYSTGANPLAEIVH